MPIYELVCKSCGDKAEVIVSDFKAAKKNCQYCGIGMLLRPTSAANYQIKGDNSASTKPKKSKSTEK